MALTQKQQRTVGDWLARHATIASCPACGLQEHHQHDGAKKPWWTVGNDLYGMPSLTPGGAHPSLNLQHGQVFASVHCNRCGYVMLFNEGKMSNLVP